MDIDISPCSDTEARIFEAVSNNVEAAYPSSNTSTFISIPNSHFDTFQSPISYTVVSRGIQNLFSDLGLELQHDKEESVSFDPNQHQSFLSQLCQPLGQEELPQEIILIDSGKLNFLRNLLWSGQNNNNKNLLNDSDCSLLLECVAQLTLKPLLTYSIGRSFSGILPGVVGWLLKYLEYDGIEFHASAPMNPSTVVSVLQSVTLLAEIYPFLNPFLCILLRHPLLQSPTSILNPRSNRHLTLLHTIVAIIPSHHLPSSWQIPPPDIINEMKFSSSGATRFLAWRLVRKWIGLFASKGESLRNKWVYDSNSNPNTVPSIPDPLKTPSIFLADSDWVAEWTDMIVDIQLRNECVVAKVNPVKVDVWTLPLVEVKQKEYLQRLSSSDKYVQEQDYGDMDICPVSSYECPIDNLESAPFVVSIHGIWLPYESILSSSQSSSPASLQPQTKFVLTQSSKTTLQNLALHLSSRLPTLITSPSGGGKSLLIRQLAFMTHAKPPIFVSLADPSVTSGSLVGSLASSTQTPGKFEYLEGVLTRALRLGRWIVFRDIEKANQDVLVLLGSIAEKMITSNSSVGLYADDRWVEASQGFMLFSTTSVQHNNSSTTQSQSYKQFFGSHQWSHISMAEPTPKERRDIIRGIFADLNNLNLLEPLIECWEEIVQLPVKGRPFSFSDLIRWCRRVAENFRANKPNSTNILASPVFQDEVFVEATDVFLGHIDQTSATTASDSQKLQVVSNVVGKHLGLSDERVSWLLSHRVPQLGSPSSSSSSIVLPIGRTHIRPKNSQLQSKSRKRPFALTRPSLKLLEKLAVCVELSEPVLLVGETGTGKTAAVSELARLANQDLISLNMSSQTEVDELVGGWKPVTGDSQAKRVAADLVNFFLDLFDKTFNLAKNAEFISAVNKAAEKKKWSRLVGLFKEAIKMAHAKKMAIKKQKTQGQEQWQLEETDQDTKRRKLDFPEKFSEEWDEFRTQVAEFEHLYGKASSSKSAALFFSYIEGPLVKALQNGHWILLDEVNLASPDTLESLSAILQSPDSSLTLSERGDLDPIRRHHNFRIFACMNPATDVGKRDLPPALRAKFSEFWVPAPDSDKDALVQIVQGYIGSSSVGDRGVVMDIAELYREIKDLAVSGVLADGANEPPHYSMRTLTRAMSFAVEITSVFGLRRALLEGFLMAFCMSLNERSQKKIEDLLARRILGSKRDIYAVISQVPPLPSSHNSNYFVSCGPFHLSRGPLPPDPRADYILTPSVQSKVLDISRVLLTRSFPVLIQGPTSSGKTSIIEYLANRTGHRFVRINNHEHTDIQEYIGSYSTDPQTGRLVFKEGVLVRALKEGHWIVLDELNLAPTDVLEALNRLLDDNRELYIPETREIVKPHPNFMLFATQNPPGVYGGRKALSRAFRNRFLEFHFDDVPKEELEHILCERCKIAPSYAQKIVNVFLELQRRRQSERMFEQRQGFVTLRDLFRWGGREAVGYERLAEDGYVLLAERTRKQEDKQVVKQVLEEIMKVKIDETALYDFSKRPPRIPLPLDAQDHSPIKTVWNQAMRRLYSLVSAALSHNEPVLLVGETGCGKTSVCQIIAATLRRHLRILNCHQNTETSDILGSQRPVRNRQTRQEQLRVNLLKAFYSIPDSSFEGLSKSSLQSLNFGELCIYLEKLVGKFPEVLKPLLNESKKIQALFEWNDGPLVKALQDGDLFLLDEISLAEDSVLERLNSVLEYGRTLVLAERGGESIDDAEVIANKDFQMLATMNPGGDYGKKELSPALRNRFTEIWVPLIDNEDDLKEIVDAQLRLDRKQFSQPMIDFRRYYIAEISTLSNGHVPSCIGLRDLLSWSNFINSFEGNNDSQAFLHGAYMTILDGIGTHPATSGMTQLGAQKLLEGCCRKLEVLVGDSLKNNLTITDSSTAFGVDCFYVQKGDSHCTQEPYSFAASTVLKNIMKVLRALQLSRPLLLEGSPGVGKTSLLTSLAVACNRKLVRINLSDQTDLTDLFGNDLPVEGGSAGEFTWQSAPFLDAMKGGHWVLLDEMNLASQSVLEGLNSCLDHRGEVFIPELNVTFSRHPNFRIFASQNPLSQGGARKGLPKSFLDRFTRVFMSDLTCEDYFAISKTLYPNLLHFELKNAIEFTRTLSSLSMKELGADGAPWEFNLRDILRWLQLTKYPFHGTQQDNNELLVDVLFVQRFRQRRDRHAVSDVFKSIYGVDLDIACSSSSTSFYVTPNCVTAGISTLSREDKKDLAPFTPVSKHLQRPFQALSVSVEMGWLSIITGKHGSGKTTLVKSLSALCGKTLRECHMSSQSDTSEILGSFEQFNEMKTMWHILVDIKDPLELKLIESLSQDSNLHIHEVFGLLTSLIADFPFNSNLDIFKKAIDVITMSLQYLDVKDRTNYQDRLSKLTNSSTISSFTWVNGVLVNAMLKGDWLIIENANLCSASILDRLNALFEPNGELSLSERGLINSEMHIIRPHPNFRLFLTVNPKYGELSRAMRNRGIEINLDQADVSCITQQKAYQEHTSCTERLFLDYNSRMRGVSNATSLKSFSLEYSALDKILTRLPTAVTLTDDDPIFQHWLGWINNEDSYLAVRIARQFNLLHFLLHRTNYMIQEAIVAFAPFVAVDDNTHILDISLLHHQSSLTAQHSAILFDRLADLSKINTRLTLLEISPVSIDNDMSLIERSVAHSKGYYADIGIIEKISTAVGFFRFTSNYFWNFLLKEAHNLTASQSEIFCSAIDIVSYLYHLSEQKPADSMKINAMLEHLSIVLQAEFIQGTSKYTDLLIQLDNFAQVMKPKKGKLMKEIWQIFKPIPKYHKDDIDSADLLRSVNSDVSSDLRSVILEMGAMIFQRNLESWSTNGVFVKDEAFNNLIRTTVTKTRQKLPEISTQETESTIKSSFFRNTYSLRSSIASIGWTRLMQNIIKEQDHNNSHLMSIASSDPDLSSLEPLVPFQVIVLGETESFTGTHATKEAITAFLLYIASPKLKIIDDERINSLLGPSLLQNSLRLNTSFDELTLESLPKARKMLDACMDNAFKLSVSSESSRLRYFIDILLHLCKYIFTSAGSTKFSDLFQNPSAELLSVFNQSDRYSLQECLIALDNNKDCDAKSIGVAYVATARALWTLYVPDVAMDPVGSLTSYFEYICRRIQYVLSRLDIEIRYSRQNGVTTPSVKVTQLIKSLEDLRQAAKKIGVTQIERKSDTAFLERLFVELRGVESHLVSHNNVERLLDILHGPKDESSLAKISSFQQSLDSFNHRIRTIYGELVDITRPVRIAIALYKIGFSFLKHHHILKSSYEANWLSLVNFPDSGAAAEQICPNSVILKSLNTAILTISSFHYLARIGQKLSVDSFITLKECYDVVFFHWKEEQEEKRNQQSQGLYIYKEDIPDYDEAAEEEKEFFELFPSYEESSLSTSDLKTSVSRLDSKTVIAAHLEIFGGKKEYLDFAACRENSLRLIKDSSCIELDSNFDLGATAFYLTSLKSAYDSLHVASHGNFYIEPNVPEAEKARKLIQKLQMHVTMLHERWPEQMVLMDLKDRCDSFLKLQVQSPVAQILAALERLLLHVDEWEKYASTEFSLQAHQVAIINLIIEWRKLELSSWSHVLTTEEFKFREKANESWFNFYEIIKSIESGQDVENSSLLKDLVQLLDTFLLKGPVGQFQSRMDMVQSFSFYLEQLDRSSTVKSIYYSRAQHVFRGAKGYYSQHSDTIREQLRKDRSLVDKEVSDLIRLASWKDVNVQALSQSAKHTHHQLHKCIRKYRQTLQKPTSDLIQIPQDIPSESDDLKRSRIDPPALSFVPYLSKLPPVSIPAHIANLSDTLTNMTRLVGKSKEWSDSIQAEEVNALVVNIISQSDSLRLEKPRGDSPEVRAKHERNIHSRKRRAFAELLGILRKGGLNSNPVESTVKDQQNLVNLFQVFSLSPGREYHVTTLCSASNKYFERMLARLSRLQLLPSEHHDDISGADMQKLVGYISSLFGMIYDERKLLVKALREFEMLQGIFKPIYSAFNNDEDLAMGDFIICHPLKHSLHLGNYASQVIDAIKKILEKSREDYSFAQLSLSANAKLHVEQLSDQKLKLESISDQLRISGNEILNPSPCFQSNVELFNRFSDALDEIKRTLTALCEPGPLRPIAESTRLWMQSRHLPSPQSPRSCNDKVSNTLGCWERHQRSINSILVVLQDVFSQQKLFEQNYQEVENDLLSPGLFRYHSSNINQVLLRLRTAEVLEEISEYIKETVYAPTSSKADYEARKLYLQRTVPFLEQYLYLCESHFIRHVKWHLSRLKLVYVISNIAMSLGSQGFCRPQEDGDEGGSDKTGGKELEGTGIGQGKGNKNVSKEIESDEQVEGLQNDVEEEQDDSKSDGNDEDKDEDAVEMEDDLQGKTKNVTQEKDENDESKDDDNQEEEDKVSELDPLDPSAVDEKFWADPSAGESDNVDEKVDQPEETQTQTDNLTAQVDDKKNINDMNKKENKNSEAHEESTMDEIEENEVEGDDEDEDKNEGGNDADGDGDNSEEEQSKQNNERQLDVPEGELLDIPDDINVDDDVGNDDGFDHDDVSVNDSGMDENEEPKVQNDTNADSIETEKDLEVTDEDAEVEKDKPYDGDHVDSLQNQQETGDNSASNTLGKGAGTQSVHGGIAGESNAQVEEQTAENGKGSTQSDTMDNFDKNLNENLNDATNEEKSGQSKDGFDGYEGESRSGISQREQLDSNPPSTNPFRSLGDAMEDWRRRLKGLDDHKPNEQENIQIPEGLSTTVEYIEESAEESIQAVGPATEEQLKESKNIHPNAYQQKQDIEESKDVQHEDIHSQSSESKEAKTQYIVDTENGGTSSQAQEAILPEDRRQITYDTNKIGESLIKEYVSEMEVEETQERDGIEEEIKMKEDSGEEIAEEQLMEWQRGERKLEPWEVWRMYSSLTMSLQVELTEQLRLILEPTLATRLKGDYRTGKRLNMRKVITYIASDFTKDKIWLRRTKPSGRAYQVLLAVDDSQSMADSNVVHLAFQTLALVCGALGRLEVGEVGVTKFGQEALSVHDLDAGPVTDDKGVEIVKAFSFRQKSTNMKLLLEKSLVQLSKARERRTFGTELWQLMIIISDGVCHNVEEISALLRMMREQKVLVVFLVVDSLNQKPSEGRTSNPSTSTSIMDMQTVSFSNGEIQMQRYLDSFPFEHYVVLRAVEALPEVLCGILRQFFERASFEG